MTTSLLAVLVLLAGKATPAPTPTPAPPQPVEARTHAVALTSDTHAASVVLAREAKSKAPEPGALRVASRRLGAAAFRLRVIDQRKLVTADAVLFDALTRARLDVACATKSLAAIDGHKKDFDKDGKEALKDVTAKVTDLGVLLDQLAPVTKPADGSAGPAFLYGTASEKTKKGTAPLDDVTVSATRQSGLKEEYTATSLDGAWCVEVPPDHYRIVVTSGDRKQESADVAVPSGKSIHLDATFDAGAAGAAGAPEETAAPSDPCACAP